MKVLFWTFNNKIFSAAARYHFYQMSEGLKKRGLGVELTTTNLDNVKIKPDIVIIQYPFHEQVKEIRKKWNCRIGVTNPQELGVEISKPNFKSSYAIDNIDFFVVDSFVWRDMMLPFGKPVYINFDYEDPEGKFPKKHEKTNNIVIGYHGNHLHYAKDFFPHGAKALQRIAKEYDILLKVITSNVRTQPKIEGVRTEFIEFNLDTFYNEIQTFDIGICPTLSKPEDISLFDNYIRNPNRTITLLFYGIPSITSPIPQNCHDLTEGETALFAVTEEGWYQALKKLINRPTLRNKIGRAGYKMAVKKFSKTEAENRFIEILKKEWTQ